jgi:hypothetical protein
LAKRTGCNIKASHQKTIQATKIHLSDVQSTACARWPQDRKKGRGFRRAAWRTLYAAGLLIPVLIINYNGSHATRRIVDSEATPHPAMFHRILLNSSGPVTSPAPVITVQPQSADVAAGAPATGSTLLPYQWFETNITNAIVWPANDTYAITNIRTWLPWY